MKPDIELLNGPRLKFFVGLNTGYVVNGNPETRMIEFYQRRSSHALFCAVVGNVVIPGWYGTNSNTPLISRNNRWHDLASAISNNGTLPGIQLAAVWNNYSGERSFRPSNGEHFIEYSREIVRGIGIRGIRFAIQSLNEASDLAIEAGFRHLQIHAAHGYLFNLLVDERINSNAEETLFLIKGWVNKYSNSGVETSIRISLKSGDAIFDANGNNRFYSQITEIPFDFIDISSGFYNINKQLIYPGRPDLLRDRRLETIHLARRFPDRKFIISGRALDYPEQDLPSNLHIGLCRDLISNPDYLRDNSRHCENHGKCHYYSRGENSLTCAQWK